ncbi:hypothetical protein BDW02DRAFT_577484 [Decorospora gaudefroyi]|uniref:Uncharacterized protein n=1 Tax=Decorospora gaudefroyi TaxID=184978 RepID=A0A6A5KNV2_9PLEO|nr:hypothetical protein BDW02DRAFT_577484 [Decorospora gaudefroyi]
MGGARPRGLGDSAATSNTCDGDRAGGEMEMEEVEVKVREDGDGDGDGGRERYWVTVRVDADVSNLSLARPSAQTADTDGNADIDEGARTKLPQAVAAISTHSASLFRFGSSSSLFSSSCGGRRATPEPPWKSSNIPQHNHGGPVRYENCAAAVRALLQVQRLATESHPIVPAGGAMSYTVHDDEVWVAISMTYAHRGHHRGSGGGGKTTEPAVCVRFIGVIRAARDSIIAIVIWEWRPGSARRSELSEIS